MEPYFQDGVVAQKVEEAIASGVIFVTSAGNDADEHYQNLYVQNRYSFGNNVFNLHDFGLASQGPSAISMPIMVGGTAFSPTILLQFSCNGMIRLEVQVMIIICICLTKKAPSGLLALLAAP